MSDTRAIEDLVTAYLKEGPTAAPHGFVESVFVEFPTIPQRRAASRVPWGLPATQGFARSLAVLGMAAIAFGGIIVLDQTFSAGTGGPAAPPPPSVAPSPSASPGPAAIDTSTWKTFVSIRHGVTLRYPPAWTATPATAPWPPGAYTADPPDPMLDYFVLPTDTAETITVTSQPLARGVTAVDWLTHWERAGAASSAAYSECWPAPAAMERATVGGQPAWIHGGCGFVEAITFVGGRVYVLAITADFDRPLFDAFLSTVRFDPARAVDTPVASPSPSPR